MAHRIRPFPLGASGLAFLHPIPTRPHPKGSYGVRDGSSVHMVPKSFTDAPPLRLGGHGHGVHGGHGGRMDGPGDGESTVTSSASEMMHMHEPYGDAYRQGAYTQGHSYARGQDHGHRGNGCRGRVGGGGGGYDHSYNWGMNLHDQPEAEKENERKLDPDLERFFDKV